MIVISVIIISIMTADVRRLEAFEKCRYGEEWKELVRWTEF